MAETIVIYRLRDVPEELTAALPEGAGPWRCLFWVAPAGGQAIASLFEAIPEPHIDHVAEAMAIASGIGG